MGQKNVIFTKRFDINLRMIELWAKIDTLIMGQKGDITLDLPFNVWDAFECAISWTCPKKHIVLDVKVYLYPKRFFHM